MKHSPDIITAAGFGYQTIWRERHYLARLGAVPFALTLINHALIFKFGANLSFLQLGLYILPSFFLKGWFLAQFLRTLLMGERWPYRPEGRNAPLANLDQLMDRARGILASMIAFVVMSMIVWLMTSSILDAAGEAAKTNQMPKEPDNRMFVPALAILIFMLYAVRYLWLYIPASVLVRPRSFLRQIGGFTTSLQLTALSLICTVPPLMVGMMFSGMLLGDNTNPTDAPPVIMALLLMINEFIQLASWCICTAAIAYMFRPYLPHAAGQFPDQQQPL